jgi:hypothetical protein
MPNRWTAGQVLALAPDASSRQAAVRLAGAARWAGTGSAGDLVWGRCAGSGQNPYQTVADLAGPASNCSCPSRKFPCKHALALLLRWADGLVPETAARPDFAASWIEARRSRAPAPARTGATRDPQAAARRAGQRADRVAAGLEELARWLRDQVSTGLSASTGYRHIEPVAARMVDAQAPGVASQLRHLAGIPASGDGWPGRLLAEYAQLHLLARAHRQLAALPADLADVVRSHVGYPVTRKEVLARPAVADQWLVTGTRDLLDGTIPARRTWLRGRGTGRFALLLVFDPRGLFGGSYAASLRPGQILDAELHYYPGAPALRAVIAEGQDEPGRAGEPRPGGPPVAGGLAAGGTTAGGPAAGGPAAGGTGAGAARAGGGGHAVPAGSLAGLLDEWAGVLGEDPWLPCWPALVSGIPVAGGDGWRLAEPSGASVPLLTAGADVWPMVAVSGGSPVPVAGEWSAEGLRPLTVWHGQTAVAL